MKLVTVTGARPQFVKLGPVTRAMRRRAGSQPEIRDLIVHTGQHFDDNMSERFFRDLDLPEPAVNLGVAGGTHGAQTARMLESLEGILLEHKPDMVVVYGDTNSTLAGALAAAKLHVPLVHVESGLRSFNRAMPEELNRIVADHVSDLLLTPTPTALENLEREGLRDRAVPVGDVMYDAVLQQRGVAAVQSQILQRLGLAEGSYGVVTAHRAENVDGPRLAMLLEALNGIADRHLPLVFPVHPRTAHRLRGELAGFAPAARLEMVEPLGYLDMLRLVSASRLVLTDSGGLQKEAFFLGVPCITLREETEWLETVEAGANTVVGTDAERIDAAVREALHRGRSWDDATIAKYFGNGDSGERIVDALVAFAGA